MQCLDYLLFTRRPESGPGAPTLIPQGLFLLFFSLPPPTWLTATVAIVLLQLIALSALGNVGRPASPANEAGGCPAGQVQGSSNAGPHVFYEHCPRTRVWKDGGRSDSGMR